MLYNLGMKYSNLVKAKFLSRPNRFLADVEIHGEIHRVHIKNTGRLKELLISGCTVFLTKSDNPNRKTAYDLICVEKLSDATSVLFNIDSQASNDVCEEFLKKGMLFDKITLIKREVKYNDSRFDFYIETENKKAFLEVKGVTLDDNGIALFPDAPTQRGLKHINELAKVSHNGYEAYILFVLQYKGAKVFSPNTKAQPEFASALKKAQNEGVKIIAIDCIITPDSIEADNFVGIKI